MRVMPHCIAIDALFPLRLQRFNRVGLCNPLGENQPSLSRRSKLFAMSAVAYGLSHFAVGDFQAFGRSQYLSLQPSRINELFAGALFPIALAP